MCISGCGSKKDDENSKPAVTISYLNKDHTALTTDKFIPESDTESSKVEEVARKLQEDTGDIDMVSPFSICGVASSCQLENDQLTLYMSSEYNNMSSTDEILVRAALVRTFTSIKGINYVAIYVMDNPLSDKYGNPVGFMTADMFLDNEGSEISTYTEQNITLYFASADGESLIPVTKSVRYNSSNSIEKVVVEELIKGPINADTYPVINVSTEVISVTTIDGICYIDLSAEFLAGVNSAIPKVTIYALANSLAEVNNINKIKILINGSSNYTFGEIYDLTKVYERNLDIVAK